MMKVAIKNKDDGSKGLFADETFQKNNIIFILRTTVNRLEPTRTSIQIRDKHIEHHEGGFMNHHCNPSAKILVIPDIEDGIVVAARLIYRGEEMDFHRFETFI